MIPAGLWHHLMIVNQQLLGCRWQHSDGCLSLVPPSHLHLHLPLSLMTVTHVPTMVMAQLVAEHAVAAEVV